MFDEVLLNEIGQLLLKKQMTISCAESCTAGLLTAHLTHLSGSSAWFDMSWVTYSNTSKCLLLGVLPETIEHYGVVSQETVIEMVQGVLKYSHADIAVSISGIAGPSGGSEYKPVGTVFFALALKNHIQIFKQYFHGNREEVRQQAVFFILQQIKISILNMPVIDEEQDLNF